VASSWGDSWGSAWGDSWGAIAAVVARDRGGDWGGPSRSTRKKKPLSRRVQVFLYEQDKLTAATRVPEDAVATPIPKAVVAEAVAAVAADYGAFTAKVADLLPRKVYSVPAMRPSRVDLAASLDAFMRIEMQRRAAEEAAADEDDIELLLIAAA
jgi:hypothetical protein